MSDRRDVALFIALSAVWGSAFVATKAALASIPPVLLAALRFDIVALLLFGAAVATGRGLRPRGRGDWAPILTGGAFSIGAHHAFLFAGQQYVTAAVASTLLGLIPILTPVATHLVRTDQRPTTTTIVGLLAGFVGVVLIANPDPENLLAGATGTALVFGAAITFVFGAVLTDERRAELSPFALQAWMALIGAALLHVSALALPGESLASATWTTESVGWLVYLAVVPGAGGFFTYFRLLDRLGPVQVGLLEYSIPPFAAVFGWIILGETLADSTVAGFGAILVGFLFVKSRVIATAVGQYGGTER